MALSLFPQPQAPPIPDFNTFLVAGSYPPSAPIHLSLSHSSHELKTPTILFSPSRTALVNSLQSFDDASLTTNYGHGKVSELASKVSIFYPSTPGHLCLLLSLLRVSCLDDSTQGHAWINSQTTLASPPGLIILVEPSAYFLPETSDNSVKPLRAPTLPAYLNLITRVFASILNLRRQINGCSPKFALFDSQLDKLRLPVIYQPPLPSAIMGEQLVRQISPEAVLPLIEKYFEWVGIFEGVSSQLKDIALFYLYVFDGSLDTLYVPSSQGNEVMNDDGLHKELRYYRVGQSDSIQSLRWREVSIYSPLTKKEQTYFRWSSG
ncbi:hypothetical protein BYT27DRAFT_7259818 [Phlegmacium glaucopus]|nr:hypothetical protein BYT27DRAFT_7259818 [Phlegmacium glaucopus]